MTTFLIIVGVVLFVSLFLGDDSDVSDRNDEDLIDELNRRS